MSIDRRDRAGGVVKWRSRIFHRGVCIESKTFDRRADAERWEADRKRALSLGIDVAGATRPFKLWAEKWQASRPERAASTVTRQDGLLRIHVLPRWGDVPVEEIRRSDLRLWGSELSAMRSRDTARLALGVVRQVLALAVDDRALVSNPADAVGLGGGKPNEPRPLTHEELWRIAGEMPDKQWRVIVLVLGYGGLRLGELAGLNVGDFDSWSGTLSVSKAFARSGSGDQRRLSDTKSGSSRVVPLPRVVVTELVELLEKRTKKTKTLQNPLFYFTKTAAHRLSQDHFRTLLASAASALKIPHLTPHHLRDTCATLAISAGASVVEVSRLLGHESPAVTLRHYASFFPSGLETVASRLNAEAEVFARIPQD